MGKQTDTFFVYDDARFYAKQCDLVFQESWVPQVDKYFFDGGFTQEQVNLAMRLHIWYVAYLFKPKTYTWKQRIALATRFLFGIT